jgi:hypothetical protein
MKWCCMGFQGHVAAAGTRGFGAFASRRDSSEPTFILQHRALDRGALVPRTESPLSSVTDVQIRFCPRCGVNLKKWYTASLGEIDRSELQIA